MGSMVKKKKVSLTKSEEKILLNRSLDFTRVYKAIKATGDVVPEMLELYSARMLLYAYYRIAQGLSAVDSYYKAGYGKGENLTPKKAGIRASRLERKPYLRKAMFAYQNHLYDYDGELGSRLIDMLNASVADLQPLLDGTKTLKELKDEGVNVDLVTSYKKGKDKFGEDEISIKFESVRDIINSIIKLKKPGPGQIKIDNMQQDIHIHTSIPGLADRIEAPKELKPPEDIIDGEIVEKEKNE